MSSAAVVTGALRVKLIPIHIHVAVGGQVGMKQNPYLNHGILMLFEHPLSFPYSHSRAKLFIALLA